MNFEPGLESRKGRVLFEFGNMITKPSKSPEENRSLIVEMEKRIKVVEEITMSTISDDHAKSILIGIIDPITRQHTARDHGKPFENLKRAIKEFVNNADPRGTSKNTSMDIGAVET